MKRYSLFLLSVLVILAAFGVSINWVVDPLWFSYHENNYNRFQYGFDERQQKSHRLAYGGGDYDAVLLGSSRVVGMNAQLFDGVRLFNYAAAGMTHWEYRDFLEFYSRHKGSPRVIVIGLDFMDTSSQGESFTDFPWDGFESPLYQYKMLLSLDALRYAIKGASYSIKNPSFDGRKSMYTRAGVRLHERFTQEEFRVRYEHDLQGFSRQVREYGYRDEMLATLKRIRDDYPSSRLVLYTTPITLSLFEYYLAEGLGGDYQRWIGELMGEFDEVYNFMGDNEITRNDKHFADAHHAYPEYLDSLVYCLSRQVCDGVVTSKK